MAVRPPGQDELAAIARGVPALAARGFPALPAAA